MDDRDSWEQQVLSTFQHTTLENYEIRLLEVDLEDRGDNLLGRSVTIAGTQYRHTERSRTPDAEDLGTFELALITICHCIFWSLSDDSRSASQA